MLKIKFLQGLEKKIRQVHSDKDLVNESFVGQVNEL
jgi:hypothetical protein